MEKEDFKLLEYFEKDEIADLGTDYKLVKFELLFRLNHFRRKLGGPIILTSLDKGIHAEFSFHYPQNTESGLCEAADWIYGGADIPQNKIIQFALDVGFKGIGVYDWGFHCDLRPNYALWKCKDDKYLPLI